MTKAKILPTGGFLLSGFCKIITFKTMKIKLSILSAALIFLLMSLKLPVEKPASLITGPATIIYKTKADYSKNVPVTLSEDKSHILSYPAPQDVYFHGILAYPTALAKGFLLDNRGLSVNSAFISLTYEEYAKLPAAPAPDELYKMIIDKDPFTEMYNLGSRYRNATEEINELIERHKLKHFKRLK
jgi:hypothetical protein